MLDVEFQSKVGKAWLPVDDESHLGDLIIVNLGKKTGGLEHGKNGV